MRKTALGLALALACAGFLSAQAGTQAGWASISAGGLHTAAIAADGTLWAWGNNATGELGDGTTIERSRPVQIGTDANWAYVSAGRGHTVAIRRDGSLWAWGVNVTGQLGDGTTQNRPTPVRIGADTNWISVSAGQWHTVAIRRDGSLWAWGGNYGRLGDGAREHRLAPVRIGADTNWASVSAASDHTAAIRRDGTLWAWGHNDHGQLGDGTTESRLTPVRIGADTNWASVSAGGGGIVGLTLAVRTDGTLWAWGHNGEGQLGDGTTENRHSPVQVGTDADWAHVHASIFHSVGIRISGALYVWGWKGLLDQAGRATSVIHHSNFPVALRVGGQPVFVSAVSVGNLHTAAVRTDGSLWAWGDNHRGQIGDGTTANRPQPVQIGAGMGRGWAYVSAGDHHAFAIAADGTLWAWGHNQLSQLGDGTREPRHHPVHVGMGNRWISVCARRGGTGFNGVRALRSDGELFEWRISVWMDDRVFPTHNRFLTNMVSVSRGYAVRANGTLWGGSQIGSVSNWASVSGGLRHAIAVRTNGTLWAWGDNDRGQVGNGTVGNRLGTVQIGTATNWAAVSAGWNHSAALRRDGSLWLWGANCQGQIGDGSTTDRSAPVRVGTTWAAVSPGFDHTVAISADGSLWAWGNNRYGQLGDGTNASRHRPVRIGNANDWVSVSAGSGFTVATRRDGTLWAWGRMASGTFYLSYGNAPVRIL